MVNDRGRRPTIMDNKRQLFVVLFEIPLTALNCYIKANNTCTRMPAYTSELTSIQTCAATNIADIGVCVCVQVGCSTCPLPVDCLCCWTFVLIGTRAFFKPSSLQSCRWMMCLCPSQSHNLWMHHPSKCTKKVRFPRKNIN